MNREEQIEKARELLACGVLSKEACDAIKNDFPELAESEDERIRKALIPVVDRLLGTINFPFTEEQVLNWFEKQKEQKPAELRDSRQIALMIENGRRSGVIEGRRQVVDNPEEYGLCKSVEWSEEDETMINHIIEALPRWANGLITILPSQAEEYVKRLKSLRPSWKPAEQMEKRKFKNSAEEYDYFNPDSKI